MSKAKTLPPVVATPLVVKASDKLERLRVSERIKKDLKLPPRFACVAKEAGHIEIEISSDMFTLSALEKALQASLSGNGIEYRVISSSEEEGKVKLSLTNALMTLQAFWGARENSRQDRVLLEAAQEASVASKVTKSTPKADTVPEGKPATKPAKVKAVTKSKSK